MSSPSRLRIHRLSVDQYHRMIAAGILRCGDPIELIEGWLIAKEQQSPPVACTIGCVDSVLRRQLPEGWSIRIRSSITTADSEPEPDVAVVRHTPDEYWTRHPGPKDTALVVEVTETMTQEERTMLGRMYARARIPQFWIVNAKQWIIEVNTKPQAGKPPRYRERRLLTAADSVSLAIGTRLIGPLSAARMLPRQNARRSPA